MFCKEYSGISKGREKDDRNKGELFIIRTLQAVREMTEVYRGIQNPVWTQAVPEPLIFRGRENTSLTTCLHCVY